MAIQSNFPAIRPSLLLDFANSKRLDPRITFTRASTARYYDGSTVAKAEENLVLYSEQFDNGYWQTAGNVTITANSVAAPDGTTTADTMTEVATNASHRISANSNLGVPGSALNQTATISCFIKAGTRDWSRLAITNSAGTSQCLAYFDVTNGVVGTVNNVGNGSGATASMVSAGNGWYRCVLTGKVDTAAGVVSAFVAIADADNSGTYLGDITKYIYIWGAQLEQRSAVTAYTATTTQAITNYIPQLLTAQNNIPRFDHNPTTGESLGLLIEESRTNLYQRSEEFDNAYWTKTRCSITANTIVAPDGTLTGDKLVENTDNDTHLLLRLTSIPIGTNAVSIYAKAGERSRIAVGNGSNAHYATFNLATGAVISAGTSTVSGGTITAVGNGWYRCSCIVTVAAAVTFLVAPLDDSNNLSYQGDGYSGLYLWGVQLEAGAFPTSYIPTTTASATRSADAASMTGTNFSSWYDAAEGTMYYEGAMELVANSAAVFTTFSDNTNDNYIGFRTGSTTEIRPSFAVGVSGTNYVNLLPTPASVANEFYRVAGAYKVNDFAVSKNGASALTDTTGILPVVDRLYFASAAGTLRTQRIKKFAYYPLRLTNAQLSAITG